MIGQANDRSLLVMTKTNSSPYLAFFFTLTADGPTQIKINTRVKSFFHEILNISEELVGKE